MYSTQFHKIGIVFFLCLSSLLSNGIFNLKDWDKGQAEISTYTAKTLYHNKEMVYPITLILEKKYRAPIKGIYSRSPLEKMDDLIQLSIFYDFKRYQFDRNIRISTQLNFKGHPMLVNQKVVLSSWEGLSIREITSSDKQVQISESGGWIIGKKTWNLKENPVWTEEQLFVAIRKFHLGKPFSEKIYLLPSQTGDEFQVKPEYAEISSTGKKEYKGDSQVIPVTVKTHSGKTYFLWYLAQDLFPLYRAQLPNGTVWELQDIRWERYWFID